MHESIHSDTSATSDTAPDWTFRDSRAAEVLGWCIFATGPGDSNPEIQADDEMDVFDSDNEAIVHVLRRAKLREGVLERKALAFLRVANPEYYQDEVIDIERRMGLS